jgi:hypothetical protein
VSIVIPAQGPSLRPARGQARSMLAWAEIMKDGLTDLGRLGQVAQAK